MISARLPQRPATRSFFLPLTFSDCYIPGILKQSRQVNSTHEDHNHSIVYILHLLKETPQVSFDLYFNLILEYIICTGLSRVAQSAGSGEEVSSMAKDLINSKDPKSMLFCPKLHFSRFLRFFRGNIPNT